MVFCNLFIMDAPSLVAEVRALILKLLCDEQLEVSLALIRQNFNRACPLAAITWATLQVPCHVIKSLQLSWRSDTCRFYLGVLDLQMSYSNLTL